MKFEAPRSKLRVITELNFDDSSEAGRNRGEPRSKLRGIFKFIASTAASKRVSTVHPLPEQETTFHFRSESVPQDRDSPGVRVMWVRSAEETIHAVRKALKGFTHAGG